MAPLFTVLLVGVMIASASARAGSRLDADRPSTPSSSVKALEYHLDLNFNEDFTAIGGKVDIVVEFKQLESSKLDEVKEETNDKKQHEYRIPVRVNAGYDITRIDLQTSDSIDGLGETAEPVVPMGRSEDGKLVTIIMKSLAGSFGRISIHFEGPKAPDGIMLPVGVDDGQSESGQACDLFPCLASHKLYDQAQIQLTVSRPDLPNSRVAIKAPIKAETSFEMNGSKFLRTEFEPQQKSVNTFAFFVGTRCYGDCNAI